MGEFLSIAMNKISFLRGSGWTSAGVLLEKGNEYAIVDRFGRVTRLARGENGEVCERR